VNRRSFLSRLAGAAAIIGLAPRLAFRAPEENIAQFIPRSGQESGLGLIFSNQRTIYPLRLAGIMPAPNRGERVALLGFDAPVLGVVGDIRWHSNVDGCALFECDVVSLEGVDDPAPGEHFILPAAAISQVRSEADCQEFGPLY